MNEISNTTFPSGEIVLYQPDSHINLEVRLDIEHNTVWLNRSQMAQLLGRDVKTLGKHINNALKEELSPSITNLSTFRMKNIPTVAKFATLQIEGNREIIRQIEYYSLDVIISVGYRVHSPQGIMFRAWANNILKDYLLRGYAINRQLVAMQEHNDERFQKVEEELKEHQRQIDFFIRTNQSPIEGIFFEGQIFDAYKFVEQLIQQAKTSIVLIDGYVDATVIDLLGQRQAGTSADIYTESISTSLERTATLYNTQHPDKREGLHAYSTRFHDRFLIIDDDIYHLGASIKDLGKRLFAISRMGMDKEVILRQL